MKRLALLFSVLLILMVLPKAIFATHLIGSELTYKYLGRDTGNHMVYRITHVTYRDCAGIPYTLPATINVKKGCDTSYSVNYSSINGDTLCTNGCEVNNLCQSFQGQTSCNGSYNYPGMQRYVDTVDVLLPDTCSSWIISWSDCARNASITNLLNPSSQCLYVECIINNTIDPTTGSNYLDNSPLFIQAPESFLCSNTLSPFVLTTAAVDPEGDSLIYSLVSPLGGANMPIAFTTGFSSANPIANSYFHFDSTTGILSVNPSGIQVAVYTVLVKEYRHGVLIGSIRRDVEQRVINCLSSLPVFGSAYIQGGYTSADGVIHTCPGSNLSVSIPVLSTSGSNVTVSSDIQRYPQIFNGFSFSSSGIANADTAMILWAIADTGCHYVSIEAKTDDCPAEHTVTNILKICGSRSLHLESNQTNTYCHGMPLSLIAQGDTSAIWWPGSGLSDTIGVLTFASPASPTWYYARSPRCGTDSIFINVSPALSYTVSPDTNICRGNPAHISVKMNTPGIYSYQWSPSFGLFDSLNGSLNDTLSNPIVLTHESTMYHCTIRSSTGCVIDTSVKVNIRGIGAIGLNATAQINYGDTAILTASDNQLQNNSISIPASTAVEDSVIQIGRDSTVQVPIPYRYPSPYGNCYKSARHQLLFQASELRAMFGNKRIISSISMQVGRLNVGCTLHNFTIKIGHTLADSLMNDYAVSQLTTVYYDTSYTVDSGFNAHTFQNDFVWDGYSNIVVDICFTNTTTSTMNNQMTYTYTSFPSIYCTYSNVVSMCGVTGSQNSPLPTPASYHQRPNVKFGLARVQWPGSTNSLQWLPATGVNAVNDAHANTTFAIPHSSQWYTALIGDTFCPQTDSIYVTVIGGIHLGHTRQDTVLCGIDTVHLIAYGGQTYVWANAVGTILSTDSSFWFVPTASTAISLFASDGQGHTYRDTTHITVFQEKVWPGDANHDLRADNNDILAIGMTFGDTGAVRQAASLMWIAQCASGWDSTFATGVNCVHADCDGNGIVDYSDTIAVYQNYGLTHHKHNASRSGQYPIYITTDKQLYGPSDTIRVHLNLSDGRNLIQKIYGIAYSFDMTSAATGQIISMNQKNSWLNTGLTFERLSSAGSAQIAQCRVSHMDTAGYGTIAEIDILCSHIPHVIDSVTFMVSNIRAITARGDSVTFSVQPQTVAISQYPLGIESTDAEHSIELYPNPNTGSFRVIQVSAMRTKMTVTDELGRVVYETYLTEKATNIDMGKVPSGIYTATFTSATSHESRRVVVGR